MVASLELSQAPWVHTLNHTRYLEEGTQSRHCMEIHHPLDLPPTQDASGKYRFSLGSPTKNVTILVVTVTGWGGRSKSSIIILAQNTHGSSSDFPGKMAPLKPKHLQCLQRLTSTLHMPDPPVVLHDNQRRQSHLQLPSQHLSHIAKCLASKMPGFRSFEMVKGMLSNQKGMTGSFFRKKKKVL